MKASWKHHESNMKATWKRHESIIKASLKHHKSIMINHFRLKTSPWWIAVRTKQSLVGMPSSYTTGPQSLRPTPSPPTQPQQSWCLSTVLPLVSPTVCALDLENKLCFYLSNSLVVIYNRRTSKIKVFYTRK